VVHEIVRKTTQSHNSHFTDNTQERHSTESLSSKIQGTFYQ